MSHVFYFSGYVVNALHSLACVAGGPRRFRWNVCLGAILDFGRGETEKEWKSDEGEGSGVRFCNLSVAKSTPLPSPWSRLYVDHQLCRLYTVPHGTYLSPRPTARVLSATPSRVWLESQDRQTDHHHHACARRRRCVATWSPIELFEVQFPSSNCFWSKNVLL